MVSRYVFKYISRMTTAINFYQPPYEIDLGSTKQNRLIQLTLTAHQDAKNPIIKLIAEKLRQKVGNRKIDLANGALDYIHALPLINDPPGKDIYQGSSFTLQRGGDCEKKSVVLLAICLAMGIPGQLVWLEMPSQAQDHVTVELWIDGKKQIAESTIATAKVGDVPWNRTTGLIDAPTQTSSMRDSSWEPWFDPTSGNTIQVNYGAVKYYLDFLLQLTAPNNVTEINALPFERQRALTMLAWDTLGKIYTAANYNPYRDPTLITILGQHYGGETARFTQRTNDNVLIPWRESEFGKRVIRIWQSLNRNPNDIPNRGPAGLIVRERLVVSDRMAVARGDCNGNPYQPGSDGFCDFRQSFGAYFGWLDTDGIGEGHGVPNYNWSIISWNDPPQGLSPTAPNWRFLLPLRWSFELAGTIAKKISSIGIQNWRAQGSIYQIFFNLFGARRVGLLEGNDFAALRQRLESLPQDEINAGEFARANLRSAANQFSNLAKNLGPVGQAAAGVASVLAGILPAAYGIMPTHDELGNPIFYSPGGIAFQFYTGNQELFTSPTQTYQIPNIPAQTQPPPINPVTPVTPTNEMRLFDINDVSEAKPPWEKPPQQTPPPPPPPPPPPEQPSLGSVETVGVIAALALLAK